MNTNAIRADHKVRFVGSYFSDVKLTDGVVRKMIQHSTAQRGYKVKLKLCTDGLRMTKSLFAPRLREPNFVPMQDIADIRRHVSNPSNLLCIINNAVNPYIKIVMFKCPSEVVAAEYAEAFAAMRKSVGLNGPHVRLNVVEAHDANPNWLTVETSKSQKMFSASPRVNGSRKHITNNSSPVIHKGKSVLVDQTNSLKYGELQANHALGAVNNHTDVQVKEIRMSSETVDDPVYAQVKKYAKDEVERQKQTETEDRHERGVSKTESHEYMKDESAIEVGMNHDHESLKTTQTNEELQREIHELKTFIRRSMTADHSPTRYELEDDDANMRPLKIDITERVVESAPASVRSFKQDSSKYANTNHSDQHFNMNHNNNISTRSSHEFKHESHVSSASNTGMKMSKGKTDRVSAHDGRDLARSNSDTQGQGEARLEVANFYNHYGTLQKSNFVPVKGRFNPRLSARSEASLPRTNSYRSSTSVSTIGLPTRLMLPSDSRDSGYHAVDISRNQTFNSGQSSPSLRNKVTFDPRTLDRAPHRTVRAHSADTVVKPIEKVYATQTLPGRGIVYVKNNNRILRQIPENVRIVNTSHPNYVLRSSDHVEDIKRTNSAR